MNLESLMQLATRMAADGTTEGFGLSVSRADFRRLQSDPKELRRYDVLPLCSPADPDSSTLGMHSPCGWIEIRVTKPLQIIELG